MTGNSPARGGRLKWSLKRADQLALAVVLLGCTAIFVAYLLVQFNRRSGVVEIDRAAPRTAEFRVDINRAEWPEISTLPGIGEQLARRIVDYRRAHGPFETVQSLEQVRGIGEKKINDIAPYLTLADDGSLLVRQ